MGKYKITTAKNAVQKGLLKQYDEVWVKVKVSLSYTPLGFYDDEGINFYDDETIRIPIPEPKPIDFGEAGRVLRYDYNGTTFIVKTTGLQQTEIYFSAIVIDSFNSDFKIGWTSNSFPIADYWQDITDTYKP